MKRFGFNTISMNNSLLPALYAKEVRREKIARLIALFFVGTSIIFFVGGVFLITSYFTLVFSKQDVLRRLDAEEQSLARQDIKTLEAYISASNKRSLTHTKNELRRHALSPLLRELARIDTAGVKLSSLLFSRKPDGTFSLAMKGNADTRDLFLAYAREAKAISLFDTLDSPVANLLSETNVLFELTATIKKQSFFYDEKP